MLRGEWGQHTFILDDDSFGKWLADAQKSFIGFNRSWLMSVDGSQVKMGKPCFQLQHQQKGLLDRRHY